MNTKNNRRRKASIEKIQKAFVHLLQTREVKEITVSDLCAQSGLNRSTFYANYLDIYDLAQKVKETLEQDFSEIFASYNTDSARTGALQMFTHVKENPLFYTTYFKLCDGSREQITVYDKQRAERELGNQYIKYHIEFFRSGLNAILKMWLAGGCQESPEEMAEILRQEYRGR